MMKKHRRRRKGGEEEEEDEEDSDKQGGEDSEDLQEVQENEEDEVTDQQAICGMATVEDYNIQGGWAVRVADHMLADDVTKAKDGQAVFQWSDGDRYYSTSVLYADAMWLQTQKRQEASQQTQSAKQMMIQNARQQCITAGGFKVGINNRPKL